MGGDGGEDASAAWRLFFHRVGALPATVLDDAVARAHRGVLERASGRMRDGQPFFVGPGGLVDVRVNRWFCSDELRGLSRSTWRKYAYSLLVWLNFLSVYGVGWDEADAEAQEALKVWRVSDDRNPGAVAPGTYHHDLVALRLFYAWAAAEYGVANPIRMRSGWGRRRDGSAAERPVTAPSAVRDRDVKWFDPAGFVRFRDVGLMGFTVDGRDDPGFRGRNGQRDGAFVDGLYGTGLRLQEWGSVLVAELPADDAHRGFSTCRLAAATAKYARGRRYWLPRRVLVEVLGYVEGERAHAVRRARQAGRYERLEGARVVTRVLGARRLGLRTMECRPADVSLDALDPAARRRLLVETADGLEPAGLWLNEDGVPRDPHGWEHTFTTANERLARLGFTGFAGSPHMMRHSFALRWYSVGRLLYEARFAYLTEDETRDFREQFGNAWDLVQMMLGHADQRTTRETYLEPFRSLEMELLMLHAAEAAIPDLMARIFGDERRVLGDPLAGAR